MNSIGSFGGIGACSAHVVVDKLDLLIWWSMSSDFGSIDLYGVISLSIYTTNKQIEGVNN